MEMIRSILLSLAIFPQIAFTQTYNTNDLLSLLSFYGTETLDLVPDFVNYQQDVSLNDSLAQLVNLTTSLPENSTCSWFIDNQYIYTGENLMLLEISDILECKGIMSITLRVIDENTGAIYERTKWSMIEYTFIEEWCTCTDCPYVWDVWPIEPSPQPYQFVVESSTWDLNTDFFVGTSDLLTLLSHFN